MLLLSFTARNHRSIRDEAILEFNRPELRTLRPAPGATWESSVYPVAGLFGANASGKSTVLDALKYVLSAIRYSATSWLERKQIPRVPFRLDAGSLRTPSRYELDFVLDGTRHTYGFEVDDEGIVAEWLRDVPRTRPRVLFERTSDRVSYGRGVVSMGRVAARELLLSRAITLKHDVLAPIGKALLEGVEIVPLGEEERRNRIGAIVDDLAEGRSTPEMISTVLRMADVGIRGVSLREDALPPSLLERMLRFREAFQILVQDIDDPPEESTSELGEGEGLPEPAVEAVIRGLEFDHGCDAGPFTMREESDGTLAWLALAIPAINRLRKGGLFVVDELGASLHPHLAEILIGFFQNPEFNTAGAQLLFTSHDTHLLSNLSELGFEKGQIWFTEKENDGATELFSLADFTTHRDDNVAKRYLEGRYGALPRLAPSLIHTLLEDGQGAA